MPPKQTPPSKGSAASSPPESRMKTELKLTPGYKKREGPNMSRAKRDNRVRQEGFGEEQAMWNDSRDPINALLRNEAKSKQNSEQIIAMEQSIKDQEKNGTKPAIEQLDALSALYRDNVKLAEASKGLGIQELISKVEILKGLVSHNESNKSSSARASNPREAQSQSAMDFDGPSDSPVPSPAENKHIRKLGSGRMSSQPPRDSGKEEKEERVKESSNSSRTKITFELGADIAFKPKVPGATEEHDWIQGIVTRIIGEGKSRRYDVKDPFPDDPTANNDHRTSASSMVPIPPVGSVLLDYEPGKRVLALYPGTSTFYRAQVIQMAEGGKVELLFEEESPDATKTVERRFVLDHKG